MCYWWKGKLPQALRNQCGDSSKKLEIDMPHDPPIPNLGIHPNNFISYYKDTCKPIFITSLLLIARR